MKKAKRSYLVDVVIASAFLVTAISALVFLVPINWIDFSVSTTPTFLGLDFGVWRTLHQYGGIVMIVGVVVHQVLHRKWWVTMTGKILPRPRLPKRKRAESSQTEVVQCQ